MISMAPQKEKRKKRDRKKQNEGVTRVKELVYIAVELQAGLGD